METIAIYTPLLITNSNVYNKEIVDISAGSEHTCAIIENNPKDRSLYCWGNNDNYGQVGDGSLENKNLPTLALTATAPLDTPTSTPTTTNTPTATITNTATSTPTETPTVTPTATISNTATNTPTATSTQTPTATITNTSTESITSFLPGRHVAVLKAKFLSGESVTWNIQPEGGILQSATATANSKKIEPVVPYVECKKENGKNSYIVYGYYNHNPFAVQISKGTTNYFIPAPIDRNQPTTFLPGVISNVFVSKDNSKEGVSWNLGSYSATTGDTLNVCSNECSIRSMNSILYNVCEEG